MKALSLTALAAAVATALSAAPGASARLDWAAVTDRAHLQNGQQTYYGQDPDQDHQGACSLSENAANFNALPWTRGVHVTVALNRPQLDGSRGCGMCIMFRAQPGAGGLGMTALPAGAWFRGFVNNECSDPGCVVDSAIDLNINGDGRWKADWFAVPCDVGDTPFHYKIVQSNPYWFALVVGNHAVPLEAVSAQFKPGGEWVPLQRSTQNQWQYSGEWGKAGAPPMRLRLTSITGETVEDVMPAVKGGAGKAQFKAYAKPANLPAPATVWPGYGRPWAERVFPGVPAKGAVQPRVPAAKTAAAEAAAAKAKAAGAAAPVVGPGSAAAATATAPSSPLVRPPPTATQVEKALQVGGDASKKAEEEATAAAEVSTEAAVDAAVEVEEVEEAVAAEAAAAAQAAEEEEGEEEEEEEE